MSCAIRIYFAAGLLFFGLGPLLLAEPAQEAYLKASNTGAGDEFGSSVAIFGDTLVVGAPHEDSAGIEGENGLPSAGAAYVYHRVHGSWQQYAYLKAPSPQAGGQFGYSVAVSGNTLVVGANGHTSSETNSGAAFVFAREGDSWNYQATLQASNAESGDLFGSSVAISGQTIVVGALGEDGNGTAEGDNSAANAGAAYVFVRGGEAWNQQAYLKAAFPDAADLFGFAVTIWFDSIIVGAPQEDSAAVGINGDAASGASSNSGAAYVFSRSGNQWTQEAYLKASNTGTNDRFGAAVSIHSDCAVVSSPREDSAAAGINGDGASNTRSDSGAVYLFRRNEESWSQEAYLKASNPGADDHFGQAVSLFGANLIVGAVAEDSDATGVDGNQSSNIAANSGAAYVFVQVDMSWEQQGYLKASNTGGGDQFGRTVSIAERTAVIGASLEASAEEGINPSGADNNAPGAGAVYVFTGIGLLGPEPELDVETDSGEILADNGSSVSFGSPAPGSRVTRIFTLYNRGTAPLSLLSVSTGGVNAAEFSVEPSFAASSVAPGMSATVSVTLSPAGVGLRSATLIIASNDPDETPYEVNLFGAVLPEVNLVGNDMTIFNGDATPSLSDFTDFGSAEAAGGAITRIFRVVNSGVAPLTLGAGRVGGIHHPEFAIVTQPKTTVPPGEETTIGVRFDPAAQGVRKAFVILPNDDSDENPFQFAIQGTGTGPLPEPGEPDLDVETASGELLADKAGAVDFSGPVAGSSAVRTFTLYNRGAATLRLAGAHLSGTNTSDFALDTSATAMSIPAGASTGIDVTFTPTDIGVRTATLVIGSNDPDEASYEVALFGAMLPEMDVVGNNVAIRNGDTTPSLTDATDFGSAELSMGIIRRTFQISNTGVATLSIGAARVEGLHSADYAVTAQPALSVAPGATTTLEIRFDPSAVGLRRAGIVFATNDSDENPFRFSIQGTGSGPAPEEGDPDLDVENAAGELLADEASAVDFGGPFIGGDARHIFTLHNRGAATLKISGILTTGANQADFTIDTSNTALNVAAGGSTNVAVEFAPGDTGTRTATLVIASNDPDEIFYTIALIGTVVPEINLSGNTLPILNGDATPSLADLTDFGRAELAGGMVTRVFEIANSGTASLYFGAAVVEGVHAADFVINAFPTSPIAPGARTTMEVRFDPSMLGARKAWIVIPTNDSDESPFRFSIMGSGIGPGALDAAFGDNGTVTAAFPGANARARSVVVQPDGRVLIAGNVDRGIDTVFALVRYLPDGCLDTSFGIGGTVTTAIGPSYHQARGVALQADGRIVVAGSAFINGNEDVAVVRYLPDGTLDGTFGMGGKVTMAAGASDDRAETVSIQSDSKIVIAGTTFNGANTDVLLCRFLSNGAPDNTFGIGGIVTTHVGTGNEEGHALALQRDGRILVAGEGERAEGGKDMLLVRYLSSGTLDSGFGVGGKLTTSFNGKDSIANAVYVRSNGQIVLAGSVADAGTTDSALARYWHDGSADLEFGVSGKVTADLSVLDDEITSIAVQADGGIFAGGFVRTVRGAEFSLARIAADGSLDTNFGNGGSVTTPLSTQDDLGYALAMQGDGRVILAGYADLGGNEIMAVMRYAASPVLVGDLVVEGPPGAPLRSDRSTIGFGDMELNTNSNPHIFTLLNDGTIPLVIGSIDVAGGSAMDFSVDISNTATTLAPGLTTTVAVMFHPSDIDLRTTTLVIQPVVGRPFRVALTGFGRNYVLDDWRTIHFGSTADDGTGAFTADPDGDGVLNLVEFAFGMSPVTAGVSPVNVIDGTITPGLPGIVANVTANVANYEARFIRRMNADKAGLIYRPQISEDLERWSNVTDLPTVVAQDSLVQVVAVPLPLEVNSGTRLFLRVILTAP